ncbi:MAG TPA: peptidylprolyl isomerase [Polyangiaceae bacterium]|nr:peptidylprolyl isomerase [Polyangiaceae bacterium]
MSSRRAQLALISTCLLLPACVVSTFEGPGEPPRVPTSPTLATSGRPVGGHDHEHPEHESQEPDGPVEIGARHVLVSYQGALRASPSVTRSKGEAEARANEALTRARAGENFEQLVKEFSDEPGAGERGGSLGRFQRGMMVKAFEKAAFKLAPGEVSGIVETQFGYHVIQRTE